MNTQHDQLITDIRNIQNHILKFGKTEGIYIHKGRPAILGGVENPDPLVCPACLTATAVIVCHDITDRKVLASGFSNLLKAANDRFKNFVSAIHEHILLEPKPDYTKNTTYRYLIKIFDYSDTYSGQYIRNDLNILINKLTNAKLKEASTVS